MKKKFFQKRPCKIRGHPAHPYCILKNKLRHKDRQQLAGNEYELGFRFLFTVIRKKQSNCG